MSGEQSRSTAAEWIKNEFPRSAAVRDHPANELNRLLRRMRVRYVRLVDLEHRILGPILGEVVRTVLDPTVENRFMTKMVIATSYDEMILDPYERPATGEPRGVHGGYENR